jgi:ABC-type branched-subunit amino acid transport system permease subunit
MTAVIVTGMYLALRALMRSHFGRVILAIRDSEVRVRFAGYSVAQYKVAAFVVAGIYAGVAGVLTTFHERIASPEQLSWAVSAEAVLYTTLGGTGTLFGPLLGASLVILARELLSDYLQSWLVFVALTYLVLIFFLPAGLYPLVFGRANRGQTRK